MNDDPWQGRRCQVIRGCDARDCPMASWCKLPPGHLSDHDFETPEERDARTGFDCRPMPKGQST